MKKVSFGRRYATFLGIIVIVLVGILPFLSYAETVLHERAHQREMTVAGISTHLQIRFFDQTLFSRNFYTPSAAGKTVFDTPEDRERFMNLSREELFPIAIAGIRSDLELLRLILVALLVVNTLPWLVDKHPIQKKQWYRHVPTIWLWINVILVAWAISIVFSTALNMTSPGADIPVAVFLPSQ